LWFDALLNYITVNGYGKDDNEFKKWWPASYHLIGKDILTTHTVYWPTMLKAMGLEMPKTIYAHGWWLIGESKMSKSAGNVVNPMEMANKYGVDAFRYFLMSEMSLGQDASFTEENFLRRYNSDLANDLGNLLSRVVKMTFKQNGGVVADTPIIKGEEITELERAFIDAVNKAVDDLTVAVETMKLEKGLDSVMSAVRAGNRYMEQTAPWALAKNGETSRLNAVLYTTAEALRVISTLLYPVMPERMFELRKALGIKEEQNAAVKISRFGDENCIVAEQQFVDIKPLFMRIKLEDVLEPVKPEPKKKSKNKKKDKNKKESSISGVITIDQFFQTKLKTAKVLDAEKVEGTTKLLKLQIEVGEEKRQLVAGIADSYTPEELIGKTVVIVANLKPAKIRGVESQGMLLAAKSKDGLTIITTEKECGSGLSVG
jgi:methionyl-tRNA synthetase